jgi:hypothetical protein
MTDRQLSEMNQKKKKKKKKKKKRSAPLISISNCGQPFLPQKYIRTHAGSPSPTTEDAAVVRTGLRRGDGGAIPRVRVRCGDRSGFSIDTTSHSSRSIFLSFFCCCCLSVQDTKWIRIFFGLGAIWLANKHAPQ